MYPLTVLHHYMCETWFLNLDMFMLSLSLIIGYFDGFHQVNYDPYDYIIMRIMCDYMTMAIYIYVTMTYLYNIFACYQPCIHNTLYIVF